MNNDNIVLLNIVFQYLLYYHDNSCIIQYFQKMNGNIDQTTESLKIEANDIMNNISFPNNISPRKKPWYAQQQLIIADDKF